MTENENAPDPAPNEAAAAVETEAASETSTESKPAREPVWRKKLPKWSLWFSLAVLAWFALAAFGPKYGLIDWRTGLGFMLRDAGVPLLGAAALFALVALIYAFVRSPKGPWWKAAIGLAIPAILFAGLLSMRAQAESVPPIHDVATDLRNPPTFSAETMALRSKLEANPINNYGTPLGEIAMWAGSENEDLKTKNHADLIAEAYPELRPVTIAGVSEDDAFDAIIAAMGEIGLQDVHRVAGSNTVEGVAETFAFGFKDDVVARVADGQIDVRSVSRVGVSDLGYNAARVEDLRDAIEARLSE